jgi:hypothetical protein
LNSLEIVALNSARTTFQRVSDGKFFNGWIKSIDPDKLVAHTCTSAALAHGDEFAFQVYGYRKDAFFHAILNSLHTPAHPSSFSTDRAGTAIAVELSCDLTTVMKLKEGQQPPRFCVEDVIADVALDDARRVQSATVVDIGPGGFAVITDRCFKKGDIVEVILYANGLNIQCEAEVRNCAVNVLNTEYQRTGLQIRTISRIDATRWTQLYRTIVESNALQLTLQGGQLGPAIKRIRRAA